MMRRRTRPGSRRALVLRAALVVALAVPTAAAVDAARGMLAPPPASSRTPATVGAIPVVAPTPNVIAGTLGPSYRSLGVKRPTGEGGDTSPLWFAEGRWWAVLLDATRGEQHVWYLGSQNKWVDTGTVVDDRPYTRPTVAVSGRYVYVATGGRRSYSSQGIRVTRLSFDSSARLWRTDADYPVAVTSQGGGDPRIAADDAGNLWIAYLLDGRVRITHTSGDTTRWSPAVELPGMAGRRTNALALTAAGGILDVVWAPKGIDAVAVTSRTGPPDADTWRTVEHPLYGADGTDRLSARSVATSPRGRQLFIAVQSTLAARSSSNLVPGVLLLSIGPRQPAQTSVVALAKENWSGPVLTIDVTRRRVVVLGRVPSAGGGIRLKDARFSELDFEQGPGRTIISVFGAPDIDQPAVAPTVSAEGGLVVVASDDLGGRYATGVDTTRDIRSATPPPPDLASSTVLVHDTFDRLPLGAAPAKGTWVPRTASAPAAVAVEGFGGKGRALRQANAGSGARVDLCRAVPEVVDATVRITARVQITGTGTSDTELLTVKGDGTIASARVSRKGNVGWLTADGRIQLTPVPTGPLEVTIIVQPRDRTYRLSIAPVGGAPVLAIADQKWVSMSVVPADEVCIATGPGRPGSAVTLDDLTVVRG